MTQTTTCVALQPADDAELAQHLEYPSSAIAQTSDRFASDATEALLPVEEVAITSEFAQDHEQQPDATAPFKFDHKVLAGFRRGYRQEAVSTAEKTRTAGGLATQTILEMAALIQEMKLGLSRKEFGVFVKGLLQWVGDEARKYLDLARAFDGFDLSRLESLEPFTLLKLRSDKYAPIIERLQSHLDITPKLVQDLIKELLPKQSRKKPSEPISGWKQSRSGGGRYYNLLLHDEETGMLIEGQAESEGVLPQKIIEEAVALRAQQKSGSIPLSEYRAAQLEELHTVVDNARTLEREKRGLELELNKRDRLIAELEAQLTERALVPAEICFEELTGLHFEQKLELLEPLHLLEDGVRAQVEQTAEPEASSTTDSPEPAPEEVPAHPVQETDYLAPSDEASAADRPLITPDLDMLKQLREAESYVQLVESQIQELNSKLAKPSLDRIVERELKDVLKNRQNLRINKISQIVNLADGNGIPADYKQLQSNGRIVLAPAYASVALKQAKSWADVVLVVAGDRDQLLKAVDSWTIEQRQILVQLLSTYLKTEPSGLEHVAWIPKTLLQKALTTLSFKIRKIGGPNNLVDDPKIEYISNCNFISLEYPGTNREQWIFQDSDNKRYSVFGRDEIEIERF